MPNKLPQGWVECQLGEVFNIVNGDRGKNYPAKNKLHTSGIPFVSAINIQNSELFIENLLYLNEQQYDLLRSGKINKGDSLLCIRGSIGKHCIYPFDKGAIASSMVIIRKILPNMDKFLFYYLESFCFKQEVKKYDNGTAQPNLSATDLKRFNYILPPLNEQRRIVEKIESEFAKIDEGLEHLEQAKEQIKQYRRSVLKSAFLINNKNEKCLDEITNKINDGTHKTPTYIEKGIPFISVKDIRNKQIFFDNCKYISEDEHQILFKRCNPEYGDVLITKSGTIGRTAIVNTNKVFDLFVSVALLKPKKDLISSEFLMYALDNYIAHIDIKQEVKGGVIKNLHIEDLKKIAIYLPPLGEQKKIVEEIEKRFAVADEVEKVVEENIEKAKQLKQSILKKAFEGRLVPQDPTDEPASILLEKIKKERNKK